MSDDRGNVPGRDGQFPTPICDMIEDLLSQGMSGTSAVRAARLLERNIALATSRRDPDEDRRRYERDRKRGQRAAITAAKAASVPDTSRLDIYLTDSPKTQIQSKKDISPAPVVPDSPGHPKRDDWPSDHVERFWQAYPPQRRTDKAKVERKLALIRKSGNVTWAKLMVGVERYARSGDVARGFAKGPMPWLNGGCWDDEIRDVKQPERSQRKPSLLTRLALGIDGEDHDAKQADDHAGPTLDLRPVSHR